MPSERSLYRKIEVVLEAAKSAKARAIDDLRDELKARRLPNFVTRRYDEERDEFVDDLSGASIGRAMHLCQLLYLVRGDGKLTAEGRHALRRGGFDEVVCEQVRRVLREHGVDIALLNRSIREKLRAEPPELPTAAELWEVQQGEISHSLFSRLLTLLVHCGGAKSSQRKIYLKITVG